MEGGEILKMGEDAFHHRCFITDVIVRNDDIPTKDVLKYASIVAQGQDIKSSKRELDKKIPVPSFLVYPSHRVKVVAKNIFSIVNYDKAQKHGYTKSDALIFNKYWGEYDK